MKKNLVLVICFFVAVSLLFALFACTKEQPVVIVTFETNGGSPLEEVTFANGINEIDISELITQRENYVFKGWYFDRELTKPFNRYENERLILKKPETNTRLYAAWASVYLEISDSEVYVINWDRNDSKAEIPRIVHDRTVTGIANGVFSNSQIEKAVIPESVRFIGENAFSNSKISEITIPVDLTWIGESAFQNCESLKTVQFSENARLDFIGSSAFKGTAVESVTLPNLKSAGMNIFQNCKQLKKVEFSGEVYPGDINVNDLFLDCTNIEEVSGNLGKIDIKKVFRDTVWFKHLPESGVIYQNNVAIAAGETISRVEIPEGIVEIGAGCFKGKMYIDTIILPSTLKVIGNEAFYNTTLEEIVLPEGLEVIGDNVFSKNTKIMTIPSSLKIIGSDNFIENSNITALPDSLISVGDNSFSGCKSIQSLPAKLKTVGARAFENCDGIAELPNNLEIVGGGAFRNTSWWNKQPQGVVYCYKSVIGFIGDVTEGGTLSIREGTEVICENVFNKGIFDEIKFPSTLRKIEKNAFNSVCVPKIELPEGLLYVGAFAFLSAETSEIVLPESLEIIETAAFYDIGVKEKEGSSKKITSAVLPRYTKYVQDFALAFTADKIKISENFLNVKMLLNLTFDVLYLKETDSTSVDFELRSFLHRLTEQKVFEVRFGW